MQPALKIASIWLYDIECYRCENWIGLCVKKRENDEVCRWLRCSIKTSFLRMELNNIERGINRCCNVDCPVSKGPYFQWSRNTKISAYAFFVVQNWKVTFAIFALTVGPSDAISATVALRHKVHWRINQKFSVNEIQVISPNHYIGKQTFRYNITALHVNISFTLLSSLAAPFLNIVPDSRVERSFHPK